MVHSDTIFMVKKQAGAAILIIGFIVLFFFQNCSQIRLAPRDLQQASKSTSTTLGGPPPPSGNCQTSYVYANSPAPTQLWVGQSFKNANSDYVILPYIKVSGTLQQVRTMIVESKNQGTSWTTFHDFDSDQRGLSIYSEPQVIPSLNRVVVIADIDPNPDDNVGQSVRKLLEGDLLTNTWTVKDLPRDNVQYPIAVADPVLWMPVDDVVGTGSSGAHAVKLYKSSNLGTTWEVTGTSPVFERQSGIWDIRGIDVTPQGIEVLVSVTEYLWAETPPRQTTLNVEIMHFSSSGAYLSTTIIDPQVYDPAQIGSPIAFTKTGSNYSYRRIKINSGSKNWIHSFGLAQSSSWQKISESEYKNISSLGRLAVDQSFYEATMTETSGGEKKYKIYQGDAPRGLFKEISDFTSIASSSLIYLKFNQHVGELLGFTTQNQKIITLRIQCN
jgi:hypothetical protein